MTVSSLETFISPSIWPDEFDPLITCCSTDDAHSSAKSWTINRSIFPLS